MKSAESVTLQNFSYNLNFQSKIALNILDWKLRNLLELHFILEVHMQRPKFCHSTVSFTVTISYGFTVSKNFSPIIGNFSPVDRSRISQRYAFFTGRFHCTFIS